MDKIVYLRNCSAGDVLMSQYIQNNKKTLTIIIGLALYCWFTGIYLNWAVAYGAEGDGAQAQEETENAAIPTNPPAFEPEFMVGLIDLTWSRMESVGGTDPYPPTVSLDGHIAFYLKGKIRGKYLLSARMDTGEKPLAELLQHLTLKDPADILRKIDPERYYPVYGDQSTVSNDAVSDGKLYVRLEWDASQVLFGDYQVSLNQTDLIQYNRSLYGLNVNLKNPAPDGTNSSATQLFLAEPFSLHSCDIMRATGSMLYYLKHADIVVASDLIKVEVRNAVSGAVLSTIPLVSGRDYDLDYAQGRLILKRELAAVIHSGQITTVVPNDGYIPYLIADYEFTMTEFTNHPGYGMRTSGMILSNLSLGGSFAHETTENGTDYQIFGADSRLQLTPNISLSGEWAQSEQSLSERFYSEDGGLTYSEFAANVLGGGSSWKIGLNLDFPGEPSGNPFLLKSYTLYRQAGFSTAEGETLHDFREHHLELAGPVFGDHLLKLGYTSTTEERMKDTSDALLQLSREQGKIKLTEELHSQNYADLSAGDYYQDVLGAFRVDYRFSDAATIYGTEQLSLSRNEVTPQNNRTLLGTQININLKTVFNLEGSTGDLGKAVNTGLQYQFTPDQQLYTKVSFETDPALGQTLISTVGERGKMSERVEAYAEHRVGSGTYENSLSDVFGIDFTPQKGWLLTFNYSQSQIQQLAARPAGSYPFSETAAISGFESDGTGPMNRSVVGAGAVYHQDALEFKNAFEVRFDEGAIQTTQYLLTDTFKNELNQNWTYYCNLNYSITKNDTDESELARFIETTLGFAYRPVQNDRLNLIGEYSFRDELSPDGQTSATSYRECDQVFSVEGIWDLNTRWQMGEKIAYKHAAIQLDPGTDAWNGNDLYLWVNRFHYHLPFHWEISPEYRILKDIQAGDEKSGFLLAVYYEFNLHNRIGAGYNFTDFNDDLMNLNDHSRGFFINFSHQW